MKKHIIRPRTDLCLRKIGPRYMIVDATSGQVNLTQVYSLNESAALLWQRISLGEYSLEELADWLAEQYDIDYKQAQTDVSHQLAEWKEFSLLQEEK